MLEQNQSISRSNFTLTKKLNQNFDPLFTPYKNLVLELCDIDNIIVYNMTLALLGKITITIFCEPTWCKLPFAYVTKLLLTLLS